MNQSSRRHRQLLLALVALACCLVGSFMGSRAGTAEISLDNARSFGDVPTAGIILHLHGCNGVWVDGWTEGWIDFLTDRGFLVVIPDSFADPSRPAMSCRMPFPNKTEIYELRYRQTDAAVAALRKRFPDWPVIVWGHSEGGGVANMLDLEVDGIITTGYQCGFRRSGESHIRKETPLLAIMGTRDPYILNALSRSPFATIEEICQAAHDSPQWQSLTVEGMGHDAPLALPAVRTALERFLEVTSAR